MSKVKKSLLIVLCSVFLVSLCVISLYLYAKKEINKEKFIVPEENMAVNAELKTAPSDILSYTQGLYTAAFTDETTVTKTVSIDIPDESIKTNNLSDDDYKILLFAKSQYIDFIKSKYTEYENIGGDKIKDIRPYDFEAGDISGKCIMTEGITDDNGNVSDVDFYCFNAEVSGLEYPIYNKELTKQYQTFAIGENIHILDDFKNEISDMGEVIDENIEITSGSVSGKIDKYRNQLVSFSISHTYTCYFTFQFENEYERLDAVEFCFNYIVTENYGFNWYGAYLTSGFMYMNPGDETAIPLDVNIGEGDYKIVFSSSDESKVTVSDDGLVSAVSDTDKPVEIKYSLKYKGYDYTGSCFVTVTSLTISETEVS